MKRGHRVIPPRFPLKKILGSQVTLADSGLLLPADKTTVEYKLQGTAAFIAPERFHGHDPSPASDPWSSMAVLVYLYLGEEAFPNTKLRGKNSMVFLHSIWENLGPLPKCDEAFYTSSSEEQVHKPAA